MKIGIIGTGMIGGALARRLVALGHIVAVANSRGVEGVRSFADEVGAEATDAQGAVTGADAVVIAIPLPAVEKLPKGLFDNLPDGVPVIDIGNYYPDVRDANIAEIDGGLPESVWTSNKIGRSVVKAFNTITFTSLSSAGKPKGVADRVALAVAGDNSKQKQVVMDLVDQLGFDPVDAGTLADSWRQEPGSPGYCCDYGAADVTRGLAKATRQGNVERRDAQFADMKVNPPTITSPQDVVDFSRRWYGL